MKLFGPPRRRRVISPDVTTITDGPREATSAAQIAIGGDAWINEINALTLDSKCASGVSFGTFTDYLYIYDFGFSLPVGAVIESMNILVRAQDPTFGGGLWEMVPTVDGATPKGSSVGFHPSGGLQDFNSGFTLFGTTFSRAEVNGADFGVLIKGTSSGGIIECDVDYVTMSVRYH